MNHIFVSSTFTDLNQERDYIFRNISTAINDFAAMYGEEYKFTDLRLGVEDTKNDFETVCRCLKYLKAAPPPHPFIVILGDRHGWEPSDEVLESAINSFSKKDENIRKSLLLARGGASITEMEINYGAYGNFCRTEREKKAFRDRTIFIFKSNISEDEAQNALKMRIRRDFPSQIISLENYGERPLENPRLRDEIFGKLIKIISNAFSGIELSPAQLERKLHENYMGLKAKGFCGRKKVLSDVRKVLFSEDGFNDFTYIYGESGAGKSSLLSKLALECKKKIEVFPVFCGLTKASDSALEIMREIYAFLKSRISNYSRQRKSFIDEYNAIFDTYDSLEETAPLLFSIDAIDQLRPDSYSQGLLFLPRNAHKKISFLFSGTFDGQYIKNKLLKFKQSGSEAFESYALRDIKKSEIPGIVDGIFSNELRVGKVSSRVCDYLKNFDITNPLYLSIVLQRISLMSEQEMMHTQDASSIREDAFIDIINSFMLGDDGAPVALHTLCVRLLESCAMQYKNKFFEVACYISQSRHGLPVSVIEGLFNAFGEEFNEEAFYTFCFTLNHIFIKRRDGRIDFTHKCFREALNEYLKWRESEYLSKLIKVRGSKSLPQLEIFDSFLPAKREEIHKNIFEVLNALPDSAIKDSEIFYHAAMCQNSKFIYKYIDENSAKESDNQKQRQIKNTRLKIAAETIHEDIHGKFRYFCYKCRTAPLSVTLFYLNIVPKYFSISLIDSYNLSKMLSVLSSEFHKILRDCRENTISNINLDAWAEELYPAVSEASNKSAQDKYAYTRLDRILTHEYHKEPLTSEKLNSPIATHSPVYYLYYTALATNILVKLYNERKYQFDFILNDTFIKDNLMMLSDWVRAVSRIYEEDLSEAVRRSRSISPFYVAKMLRSSFEKGNEEDFEDDCIIDFYDGARKINSLKDAHSQGGIPQLLNEAVEKLFEAEKLYNDAAVTVDYINTAYEGTNLKLKRAQIRRNFYKFRELAATDDVSEKQIERYVVFIKNYIKRYNELERDKDLVYKISVDSFDFLCRYLRYYGFHKYAFEAAIACLDTLEDCGVSFLINEKYYYNMVEVSFALSDDIIKIFHKAKPIEEFFETLHLRPERYCELTEEQKEASAYNFLKLKREYAEKKLKTIPAVGTEYLQLYSSAFERLLSAYEALYVFCKNSRNFKHFAAIHQKEFFSYVDAILSANEHPKYSSHEIHHELNALLNFDGSICNCFAYEVYKLDISSLLRYLKLFEESRKAALSPRSTGKGMVWEWKRPSKKGEQI